MAYRNKTYVCFDADSDIHYYRLMCAWQQSDKTSFSFYNAHEINNLMPYSSEETIKRKLRERINNTKVFVVLIGSSTRNLYRFVRWEIEQAIKLDLPIVAVNLNGRRSMDPARCPSILKDELAIHISYNQAIMQFALENWEHWHKQHRSQGDNGPYYYGDAIYSKLGL